MFDSARFFVHDSVQNPDGVGMKIQTHGGRVSLDMTKADVVIVDRERTPSNLPDQAEVVHYTWVDLCLKRGLRLPYTYRPRSQAETPVVVHAETSPTRFTTPPTMFDMPPTADPPIERLDYRGSPAQYNGVLPLPTPGTGAQRTVNGEVKKLLKAVSAMRSTQAASGHAYMHPEFQKKRNYHPPRQARRSGGGSNRLGLDARIGRLTVREFLNAPDLPELPKDLSTRSKYAFFDEVLQWVLEREPTTMRLPLNTLVYEMGGRKLGELGALDAADEAVIVKLRGGPWKRQQAPLDATHIAKGGATRKSVRLSRGRRSGSTGDQAPDSLTAYLASHYPDDTASPAPGLGTCYARAGKSGGSGNSELMEYDDDEEEEEGSQDGGSEIDIDDWHAMPTAVAGQRETSESKPLVDLSTVKERARALFPELDEEKILHDLAKCVLWFEDYVALHKYDVATQATKRATIWQHMAIKFKSGTNDEWRVFYQLKETEITRRVQALRAHPATRTVVYQSRI
ncbi:hypothetical protein AURDEDRAFT_129044 [Auricularia subglabra TFB-10046 SS5]|nr:hypothetical protein AURDEDRAFT_129044 [Auricularia subglabra TFB-10046 SS5]